LWYKFYQDLPKVHRHSLGQRIDTLFVEVIEAISAASFLSPAEKHPYVRLAIKKADTLRVLLLVLWETKSLLSSESRREMKRFATRRTRTRCHDSTCCQACRCTR